MEKSKSLLYFTLTCFKHKYAMTKVTNFSTYETQSAAILRQTDTEDGLQGACRTATMDAAPKD